ncbi:MAG: acyl-CoA dehydrogenase C-terminal domain-containing protein [Bdellovibrionales bacterium]
MPIYKAPIRDMNFVLFEVLGAEVLAQLPGYEEATPDMFTAVLEEAGKVAEEVLLPLNRTGDEEGCTYMNGDVRTPKGFPEAYKTFREGGWTALAAPTEHGGQGLPLTLDSAVGEMFCSANLSFSMYPGLSHGALRAIETWGTDEQKHAYLPKLTDGTWSGTMCLTEPHCGTDLGLIRTKAVPDGKGAYKITGTKIFISAGEHDLTDNIIHLVLAKLPDAPAGTKGISLFIVPKFMPKADGTAGARNGVRCGSIEHKMGIKASATCVMNFDDAVGYLIGPPNSGMKAMFTMMNAARLGVGLQGLSLAEIATQNAVSYAKDRLQGRSLAGAQFPDKPADPLIVHPDVRKNLLTMKAYTEGCRALAFWTAMHLDISHKHPDAAVRKEADDLVQLMTPIVKSLLTDKGSEVANLGMQVYGGHGYIREHGMEQYVRDARITQIYEGANGIQALDLVGRKLGDGMGRLLRRFFHPALAFMDANAGNAAIGDLIPQFGKAFNRLQQATLLVAEKGMAKPEEAGAMAMDYLNTFGLVAVAYMWLQMAKVASEKLPTAANDAEKAFYDAKIKTAQFYFAKILPQVNGLLLSLQSGAKPLMAMTADQF